MPGDNDTMPGDNETYKTMDLALRVGELMLSSGAGAADVSAQMDNVGRACGLQRFSADVTFTELAMSHQPSPVEPALIQIRQVSRREVDYGHLTEVDRLVRELAAGTVQRDAATARLKRIVSAGHSRPRWTVTVALGLMGAGVGLLLGGDWLVALIAFVAACCIDVIQRAMAQRRWPVFFQQMAGGLFATELAAATAATGLPLSPSRVISASIILLLAGVSFLGAIQDALTGFPLTAGARILEALIATAGAIAGVAAGLTLSRAVGVGIGSLDPGMVRFAGYPLFALGAALTAAAYAFSAYAPLRSLLPIAVIAGSAGALYLVVYRQDVGIAWASAVAALLIGLISFSVANRVQVPALVVVTAAIVPLLPGLSIFRGLALLRTSGAQGLFPMVTAATIAIALSSGVILGEYLAQPLSRESHRLQSKLAGPRLVGPFSVREHRHRPSRRRRSGAGPRP